MHSLNESELIRLLYTLADIQQWINELSSAAPSHVPNMSKKKLQKTGYYLSLPALVHILERHYHKIPRHPEAAKFCTPISSILQYIRQAKECAQHPAPNHSGTYRILYCDEVIGYDQHGNNTNSLTVFTDAKGNILTAFPGQFEPAKQQSVTNNAANSEKGIGCA